MTARMNPAWIAYNNGMNEGGEGFNPHPKWIGSGTAAIRTSAPARVAAPAGRDMRLVFDQRGNPVRAWTLIEEMAKDEARMTRLTDANARAVTQAAIDHARAQLAR